jgi:hypothetical protein
MRLVRKTPASDLSVPGFKLHVSDFGGDPTVEQGIPFFTVSTELRFGILGKPRRVLRDDGAIPTLVHLARTAPAAEIWLTPHSSNRMRIVPADAPTPRMFTYLHDIDHGWLIVSRADLDAIGLTPSDFSTWSYVYGETLALDEYGDMANFLERPQ